MRKRVSPRIGNWASSAPRFRALLRISCNEEESSSIALAACPLKRKRTDVSVPQLALAFGCSCSVALRSTRRDYAYG